MQDGAIKQTDVPAVMPSNTIAFDQFISFCATGGMIVDETGGMKQMTLQQFCLEAGVDPATTWRWKQKTKNFAELVRARREQLVPLARETAAWNRLYLIGMSSLGKNSPHKDQRSAVEALKTYLGHYSELRLPVQRQDVEIKHSVSGLLDAAIEDGIVEGEVIGTNTAIQTDN